MKRWIVVLAGAVACAVLGWLAVPKPALYEDVSFSTLVLDRAGRSLKLVPAADGRYRLFTALEDIAPAAREATVLYEDRRFYRHPGVDPIGLVRAAWTTYVRRSRVVGGSTITMQLARLRFDLDTRTPFGKFVQSMRALQLERHYTKDEILEAYLNVRALRRQRRRHRHRQPDLLRQTRARTRAGRSARAGGHSAEPDGALSGDRRWPHRAASRAVAPNGNLAQVRGQCG